MTPASLALDTSAIVALVLREPGHDAIAAKLRDARRRCLGAPTLVETGIVLAARLRRDASPVLECLVRDLELDVIPFTELHGDVAVRAFVRFGRGRHPAALNFGDCMAYAVASVGGDPLLCVGEDFARTDLELA